VGLFEGRGEYADSPDSTQFSRTKEGVDSSFRWNEAVVFSAVRDENVQAQASIELIELTEQGGTGKG
jgi:hypothetical protein